VCKFPETEASQSFIVSSLGLLGVLLESVIDIEPLVDWLLIAKLPFIGIPLSLTTSVLSNE
jgi:hypothetical protein